jgi:hypothetical protein
MKKLTVIIALLVLSNLAMAQTYRTSFNNHAGNVVKIEAASENITIIGHDKNEILIEAVLQQKGQEKPDKPQRPDRPTSDRAQGLKPMTASGTDNTGLGLTIEKSENQFIVQNIAGHAVSGKFVFYIPNKVKLSINEIKPWSRSSYNLSGLSGELNINALNSGFVIKDISGPVVLQSTNGNIEVSFSRLVSDKPNSLTAVNGFVDITLPSNSKADIKINAVNGEAFTDFDIKSEPNKDAVPVFPNFNIFNLNGTINGGGVPFTVSAVNGNVYIRKGK